MRATALNKLLSTSPSALPLESDRNITQMLGSLFNQQTSHARAHTGLKSGHLGNSTSPRAGPIPRTFPSSDTRTLQPAPFVCHPVRQGATTPSALGWEICTLGDIPLNTNPTQRPGEKEGARLSKALSRTRGAWVQLLSRGPAQPCGASPPSHSRSHLSRASRRSPRGDASGSEFQALLGRGRGCAALPRGSPLSSSQSFKLLPNHRAFASGDPWPREPLGVLPGLSPRGRQT